MKRALFGLALASVAASPASPVQSLAGRYSHHFENGAFRSDDVVEIVPVDARHAYVRFRLEFSNSHSCTLAGIATAEDQKLVYREPVDAGVPGRERCVITIQRTGDRLKWDDRLSGGESTCRSYCGARGTLQDEGGIAWSSRRGISYMKRLRASKTYCAAMTEWQSGHSIFKGDVLGLCYPLPRP